MNKAFGLILLGGGIILIACGYNSSQSFNSDVSRFFTGSITDKAMWMLIGGVFAALAGAVLFNGRNT